MEITKLRQFFRDQMSNNQITFTKKIVSSSNGFLVWLPKDIVDFLKLEHNSTVEFVMRKLDSEQQLTFTKRAVKSGRGYLSWIPKDVTDFMQIKNSVICEFKIKKLEAEK